MVTIQHNPINKWGRVQEHPEQADWWDLSRNGDLSLDNLHEFKTHIHWYPLNFRRSYKYIMLDHFPEKIDWNPFSQIQDLSHEELLLYQDKVTWCMVSEYQTLSERSIRQFQDKLDWFRITYYQTLSEPILREFRDKIYWKYVARRQKNLSQACIVEYADRMNWYDICIFQSFTEETLEQCISQPIGILNWDLILANHPLLSSTFLYRHRVILFPHHLMRLFGISPRLAYLRMVLGINHLQRRWKRLAYAPGGSMYARIFLQFQKHVNYEMGKKMKAPVSDKK